MTQVKHLIARHSQSPPLWRGAVGFALLLTLLAVTAVPAEADWRQNPWYVEVLAGQFYGDNDTDNDVDLLGVRLGNRVGDRWAVELAYEDLDTPSGSSSYFLDISGRYLFKDGENLGLGWTFGVGYFVFDGPFGGRDEEPSLHVGLALEWRLGERFYLRPELRQRYIDLADDLHGEVTLAAGFRF